MAVDTPGSEFLYASGGVDLLSGVVSKVSGVEADQFIAVIPDARLVLVSTGGNYFNGRQLDVVPGRVEKGAGREGPAHGCNETRD